MIIDKNLFFLVLLFSIIKESIFFFKSLFNNNSKCIVVLLLAIALICMLNQNEKSVEGMTQEENSVESVPEIDADVDSDSLLSEVTKSCVEQSDPVADQRGPVEFKKYVAGIVINKALKKAFERS